MFEYSTEFSECRAYGSILENLSNETKFGFQLQFLQITLLILFVADFATNGITFDVRSNGRVITIQIWLNITRFRNRFILCVGFTNYKYTYVYCIYIHIGVGVLRSKGLRGLRGMAFQTFFRHFSDICQIFFRQVR